MISKIPVAICKHPHTAQLRELTKEGLQRAESLLRSAQNKYGRTNSSTYLQMKIAAHKDNPFFEDVSKRLLIKTKQYRDELTNQPERNVALVLAGKTTPQALLGDCGECAQAIQNEFFVQYGKPSINIVMNIKKANGSFSNHAFNLSNIQKGIDPTKPETWGKQAIVVDMWSGIAKKNDEAIAYLKKLFNVGPYDKVTFDVMPDSERSLQHAALKHLGILAKKYSPYEEMMRKALD